MFNTIEDVNKLLEVLRKHGADEFEFESLKVKMGSAPYKEVFLPEASAEVSMPEQSMLDQMVGMPQQGLDDPFVDYSVNGPNED